MAMSRTGRDFCLPTRTGDELARLRRSLASNGGRWAGMGRNSNESEFGNWGRNARKELVTPGMVSLLLVVGFTSFIPRSPLTQGYLPRPSVLSLVPQSPSQVVLKLNCSYRLLYITSNV